MNSSRYQHVMSGTAAVRLLAVARNTSYFLLCNVHIYTTCSVAESVRRLYRFYDTITP